MKNITPIVDPLFKRFKEESITGLIKFKFTMSGNQEPIELELMKAINLEGANNKFLMNRVSVIHDCESYSTIFIECYDLDTFFEHLENLEKKTGSVSLLSALNKAILLLDDYNNMFGDKMNKTKEISELDETLKLYNK